MMKSLLSRRIGVLIGLALTCCSMARAQGIITTVAGNGSSGFSGDGGPATSAKLSLFTSAGVAVDSAGNLYIGDSSNSRVRKVTPSGTITTVAGNGNPGFSGDGGPATSAQLTTPVGVAVDPASNLYIADFGGQRIRKVTPAGTITTVAGNGVQGFSGDDGPATSAKLFNPTGVAVDVTGNIYIADYFNGRIRKVTPSGIITTVAGTGVSGFSGDGGPATSARLDQAQCVAVDTMGNLYIADYLNQRIRKVTANGIITTVAGNGNAGFSGDTGLATNAQLAFPLGVAVDIAGNLYFADSGNQRIRKVAVGGTITTVAGNGNTGFSGDGGVATSAQLNNPWGLAVDTAGNLYIADLSNNRIRKVTFAGVPTINPGGLVSGASYSKLPPSASSIASLFGTSFGTSVAVASKLPLPTSLGGVSLIIKPVTTAQSGTAPKSVLPVSGINAPLFSVSPAQINFEVPVELNDQTQAMAAVSVNGIGGNSIVFNIAKNNPAIFATNQQGTGQGVILIASSGELVAPSGSIPGVAARPAKRGEYITIYCTGLGPVSNQPADGVAALANPLSSTTTNPTVSIGGIAAPQTDGFFSGLAPGFVGLYQVNVQIPDSAPSGDAVPLTLTIGGATSNTVTIALQ